MERKEILENFKRLCQEKNISVKDFIFSLIKQETIIYLNEKKSLEYEQTMNSKQNDFEF